jgi:uncharacterized phosphosugar-binding protein
MTDGPDGVTAYLDAVRSLQDGIRGQSDTLTEVADRMAGAVADGRRIFIFGTGHSHMIAEEGHYRAGGLACVVPILYSSLMVHESAVFSSRLERTSGLARTILEQYNPAPGDILFIFSTSGVNILPIEMALTAREIGMLTVGVTNAAYCRAAPLSAAGKRLIEISDFVIDSGGVPGDAIVPVPGRAWRVGPISTVMYTLIWNCLVTETVFRLLARGIEPPIYLSNNMPDAPQHNRKLIQAWSRYNPHL